MRILVDAAAAATIVVVILDVEFQIVIDWRKPAAQVWLGERLRGGFTSSVSEFDAFESSLLDSCCVNWSSSFSILMDTKKTQFELHFGMLLLHMSVCARVRKHK